MYVYVGHNAYLGFLFLDYTYNNAVVQVFVKLLCDTIREKSLRKDTALLSFRDFPTVDVVDDNLAFGMFTMLRKCMNLLLTP